MSPRTLRVGDLVRFTALPDEWRAPGHVVPRESVAFMKILIARRHPSRVRTIDEDGTPWIAARIRRRGALQYHSWAIVEATGWRRVRRKRGQRPKK